MTNFWLKLTIWTKSIAVFAVAVYLVLFLVNNQGPESVAKLWLFFGAGSKVHTSVLELVFGAFALGVLGTVLVRTLRTTIGQIRQLRARETVERREREIEELKSKAGRLRARPEGDAGLSGAKVNAP
jgi:lysylphosphatidylglycerol synthetase-like protein (DUF2156 family)